MPAREPTPLASATQLATDRSTLERIAAAARAAKSLTILPAYDGLPYAAQLVCLGLSSADVNSDYVPLTRRYLRAPDQAAIAIVKEVVGPTIEDAAVLKSGHDLKSLTLVLATVGMHL